MESITKQIFAKIGKPKNFHDIHIVNLWDNYWRINIFVVEKDPSSIYNKTILQFSYFITTDDDGNILNSNPPLGSN